MTELQEAPDIEELAPFFPNYRFVSLIAVGGMGAVFRAVQISLDREVAIKILPKKYGDNPEFQLQFEEEAKAMAKMNHPNLLGVMDFGSAGGLPFIVMEYVDGGSLHYTVGTTPLEKVKCCEVMLQVAAGTAYVHDAGLLHRDIKPANILMNSSFNAKLADFGLAADLKKELNESVVWGTPGFTAPEVIRGLSRSSRQSDIYSLGGVFYFMLAAESPETDLDQPHNFAQFGPKFATILHKCMHANPAGRYVSVSELVDDLQELLRSLKSQGQAPVLKAGNSVGDPNILRPNPQMKVRKGNGGTVFLLFLLLCVGVGLYFWRNNSDFDFNSLLNKEEVSQTGEKKEGGGPQEIILPNSSFEKYLEVSENTFVIDSWKSRGLGSEFEMRPATVAGMVGENALLLKDGNISVSSEIFVEKGNSYTLEFLVAREGGEKVRVGKDFKVNLMAGKLVLASYEQEKRLPSHKKGESMIKRTLQFDAEQASYDYKKGFLSVRFICNGCQMYIDDLSLISRPLLSENTEDEK